KEIDRGVSVTLNLFETLQFLYPAKVMTRIMRASEHIGTRGSSSGMSRDAFRPGSAFSRA
ncbi:hypothetical protein, partial [Acidiphilium sp.]|uniref:hypothetical protein n=1 Tax=Acidiphilium sp. TaxID=527 RepID=UPI00258972A0